MGEFGIVSRVSLRYCWVHVGISSRGVALLEMSGIDG